jgi:transcriptional regulator with XRE-family HTH domain
MRAAMKLADYLVANGMAAADFAERMGVHRSTVSRWLAPAEPGKPVCRPSWDELRKMAEVTNGAVTANDFVPEVGAADAADCVA